MSACPVEFETLEDLWQLFIWFFLICGTYALLSKLWSTTHYEFLRKYTALMPEWLFEAVVITLLCSWSYAGWRVWWCGASPQPKPLTGYTSYGWDNNPVPLFLHTLFAIAFALQPAILHRSKQYIISAVWAVGSVLLCIAVVVFFFFDDLVAAIIMVVALIFQVYWMGVSIHLGWQNTKITEARKSLDESVKVAEEQEATKLDQEVADTQLDTNSTDTADRDDVRSIGMALVRRTNATGFRQRQQTAPGARAISTGEFEVDGLL